MARTYRHRISLQEPVKVQDSTTGEIFTFWQTVENCGSIPCEVLTGPGREYNNSGTIQSEVSLRVNFRWFAGLQTTWRLVWNGNAYNIKSAELDTSARREYRLACTGLGEAVPATPYVVSAIIGATGRALTWTFSAPLGGSGTLGFSLSGASVTSGAASGSSVTQVISQVLAGSVVTGSYSAATGTLVGYGGEIASFSDHAITNNSTVTGSLTAYPLNDDGTLAASFWFGLAATNSPAYLRADYTYTGAATGGAALALPASANWLTSQAVIVGAGKVLAVEAEIVSVSAAAFGKIGLATALSVGGVFSSVAQVVIGNDDGSTPEWWSNIYSPGDQVRASPTAGYRVGIEFNGNTGGIIIRTTDGSVTATATFTPGIGVTAYLAITDNGLPSAGQTCSVRLIQNAADYALNYSAGAVNLLGQTV